MSVATTNSVLPFCSGGRALINQVSSGSNAATSDSYGSSALTTYPLTGGGSNNNFLCPVDTSSHGAKNGPFLDFPRSSVGYFELPPNYDNAIFQQFNGTTQTAKDGTHGINAVAGNPAFGCYSVQLTIVNPLITELTGVLFAPCVINHQGTSAETLPYDNNVLTATQTYRTLWNAANTLQRHGAMPLRLSVFDGNNTDSGNSASTDHGFSTIGTLCKAKGGDRYTNIFNAYSNILPTCPFRVQVPSADNVANNLADVNAASFTIDGTYGTAIAPITTIITPPNQPFLIAKGRGYMKVQCYLPPPVNLGLLSAPVLARMGPVRWMYMLINADSPPTNIPLHLNTSSLTSTSGGQQPAPNQV